MMRMQNIVSAFKVANGLVEVTRLEIANGHWDAIKANFTFAEKWLREGTAIEKMAISNVFLYAIATTIDQLGKQGKQIFKLLPPLLRREYLLQINASGV